MASKNVKELTDASFDADVLKSEQPTLVDFWATWCAPCRAIAPYVESIAEAHVGKIQVGKMDIDNNPKTPTAFHVSSIPTLLLFHKGQVIGQLVGAVPKAKLDSFIKDSLAKHGIHHA